MHVQGAFFMAVLAAAGVDAQVTASGNPLNSFISQVASIASQIDPASPTQSSATTTSNSVPTTSSSSRTSSTAPLNSSLSTVSSVAAATSSSGAAAAKSSGGGLSERDKIILGVCLALGILLILLLGFFLCFCLRRRRRRRVDRDTAAHDGNYYEKHDGHRHTHNSQLLGTRRDHSEKYGHGHSSEAAAAIAGAGVGAAAHKRHSEGSDRALIAGAQDYDRHRMSGGSGLGYAEHRQSEGSMSDPMNSGFPGTRASAGSGVNGLAMHATPTSPTGVKRKPLPGQDHHDAMLGAGAGALAGAAAYKHHRDKHDSSHNIPDQADEQYAASEQNTSLLHTATNRANNDLRDKNRAHHGIVGANPIRDQNGTYQHSPSHPGRDVALLSAAAYAHRQHEQTKVSNSQNNHARYHGTAQEQQHDSVPPHLGTQSVGNRREYHGPFAAETALEERDRPPTPFGLNAITGAATQKAQPQENEGTRRSGSYPDPTVPEHTRGYPHNPHNHQHYSSQRALPNFTHTNDDEQAYIPYTPSGPYDAAVAASAPRYQRRSLPPEDRPHRPPFADEGYGRRSLGGTPPRYSFVDEPRRPSASGMRVPAAALGAVGRGSPRMTGYQRENSDSSSGHSAQMTMGRRGEALGPGAAPLQPPYASNHESYSSLASEGMTPVYDIPGAFPGEERRRPRMREERWSHAGNGNGNENSNGRRLRFSDRNEEYEIENRE